MATTGSLGLWAPVVPALAEGHKVIAYDHRGMGGSTPSENAVSMRSLADDAAALLEALDVGPAHVIGWSLGSAVAQELALNHADKVASLVLYGTWGRGDTAARQPGLRDDARRLPAHNSLASPWPPGRLPRIGLRGGFGAVGARCREQLVEPGQHLGVQGDRDGAQRAVQLRDGPWADDRRGHPVLVQ